MPNMITYEIHPAIGIARVGNSKQPDGYFLGPEPGEKPPASYRDPTGRLKRQAARFRLFRCERDPGGKLVGASEFTPADGSIVWGAHLVNRKGASPRFAVDGGANTDPTIRRNDATGDDQKDLALIIDAGARTIGAGQESVSLGGKYQTLAVPLGELRLEKDTGRLLVLGGFGTSEPVDGKGIGGFSENDSWHDDVSDGPVTATVTLEDGTKPPVKGAWAIAAPPDFAPGMSNLVTLYDTLYSLAVDRGLADKGVILAPPARPSYPTHVKPILDRALGYRWVNRFARINHGPGGVGDFTSSDYAGIDDPAQAHDVRMDIFRLLRNPASASPSTSTGAMPRLFSDDYPKRTTLPLTKVQYAILEQWAVHDNFDRAAAPAATELSPDALTRVALEACVGGAFWPGIEGGRILRDPSRYVPDEPYRLSHDPVVLRPGEITGSMALPWQADFFDCAWEGDTQKDLGWWPAQRPDDVVPESAAAGATPVPWARKIGSPDDLARDWWRLGVVVNRGTAQAPDFVETERDATLDGGPIA